MAKIIILLSEGTGNSAAKLAKTNRLEVMPGQGATYEIEIGRPDGWMGGAFPSRRLTASRRTQRTGEAP